MMMMRNQFTGTAPLVSIGLPVFNGADYVAEALESLCAQTYPDLEIIVSDNCSTDETHRICAAMAARDPRIRLSRTEVNVGAANNFNRVVELAKGDFFAWANHDDLWDPHYVERCMAALDADPSCVLAYSKSTTIDEHGAATCRLNGDLGLDDATAENRLRRYQDLFIDLDRRHAWNDSEPVEGLWIPVYGVMRTDQLRRTSLIGKYIGSDTILIEQLLMLGRFAEIDDHLFFKRDHPGRSMRAAIPYAKRSEWFTGKASGTFIFPRWRTLAERVYWSAALPRSIRGKLGCLAGSLSFYVRRPHERNALLKELFANVTRPVLTWARPNSQVLEKW